MAPWLQDGRVRPSGRPVVVLEAFISDWAQVKLANLELQAPGTALLQMRDALEEALLSVRFAENCIVGRSLRGS